MEPLKGHCSLSPDQASVENVKGIESGLVLYKTNEVAMHIIDLWYDCAMHEDCIAPKNTGIYVVILTK